MSGSIYEKKLIVSALSTGVWVGKKLNFHGITVFP